MIVTSLNNVGIVAERPMYFSWHSINSGTDAMGATQLGQDFYFADVEFQRNYTSFITILNPPAGKSANVTVSYFAGRTQIGSNTIVVPDPHLSVKELIPICVQSRNREVRLAHLTVSALNANWY